MTYSKLDEFNRRKVAVVLKDGTRLTGWFLYAGWLMWQVGIGDRTLISQYNIAEIRHLTMDIAVEILE